MTGFIVSKRAGFVTSSDRALITIRKVLDALVPVSFADVGVSRCIDRFDGRQCVERH